MKWIKRIFIVLLCLIACGIFLFWYLLGGPFFSFSNNTFWGGQWSERHEDAVKSIFFNPNKPTKTGSLIGYADYDSPLVIRARSCDLKGVKRLLEVGADVNYSHKPSRYRDIWSLPIGAALTVVDYEFCSQGLDILKEFLQRGANTDGVLVYYTERGHSTDALQLLISHCGKQELNKALGVAIEKEKTDFVDLLLRSGADPNAKDNSWRQPNLLYAVSKTKNADIIYTLLKYGADKNCHEEKMTFKGKVIVTPCYEARKSHYKDNVDVLNALCAD